MYTKFSRDLVILFVLIFLATVLRFEWLINMKIIGNPNESVQQESFQAEEFPWRNIQNFDGPRGEGENPCIS